MRKLIFLTLLLSVALLFVSCQGDTDTQAEVTTGNKETVAETVTTADVTSAEETVDEIISTTEYDTGIDEDVTVTDDKNSEIISIPEYDTVINEPLPDKTIEVRNIDRLNEMRKMLTCDDESQWNQYIESVSDCGIESKDDILTFVKLIDALPQISILDGDITWIYFSHGISEDTGKETTVVYITTKAKNGDWTRIEYVLSITDVSKKISDEIESIGDNSVLNNFVKSLDGDLTLYIETREPHPSDKGTMIQWVGHAKGIFTRIYYYTSNPSDINADNLFGNIQFE